MPRGSLLLRFTQFGKQSSPEMGSLLRPFVMVGTEAVAIVSEGSCASSALSSFCNCALVSVITSSEPVGAVETQCVGSDDWN